MSQKGFPFAPNVAAPGLSDASSSSSGGRKAKKRKGHPTYVVGDDTPKKSSIGAGIPSHDENESLGITSSQQAASAPLDSIVPSDEVLDGFMSNLPIHESAVAYTKGIGIKENAKRHQGNQYILKMDFKDFFPFV